VDVGAINAIAVRFRHAQFCFGRQISADPRKNKRLF
jgi:hypothetical protein